MKRTSSCSEIADRRTTPPDASGLGRPFEDVDELHRLAALDHGLGGHQRDPDKEPNVHQHRPDRGVRDRVEPLEAEKRVRLEQGDAQRAIARRSFG